MTLWLPPEALPRCTLTPLSLRSGHITADMWLASLHSLDPNYPLCGQFRIFASRSADYEKLIHKKE